MPKKQDYAGMIHSRLQKGLAFGEKVFAAASLAKGIYDTGSKNFAVGRAIAPVAAALI